MLYRRIIINLLVTPLSSATPEKLHFNTFNSRLNYKKVLQYTLCM